MRTFGAREVTVTVASVTDVTPHYRRIVFDAPGLFDGQPIEPASWVRLWAPNPDRPDREHQRGYTLLDPDPETGRVTIEFVLHTPAGPASSWAAGARPGDSLRVTRWSSGQFTAPDLAPDGYLLVGDPASIPGINAILAALPPDTPAEVVLEHTHDADRLIPVAAHPNSTVRWVRRGGDPNALADAIPERDWSNWYAWVTGESGSVRRVRARLKECGFPRADVKAQAYWMRGRAMGVDRDTAAEDGTVAGAGEVPGAGSVVGPRNGSGVDIGAVAGTGGGSTVENGGVLPTAAPAPPADPGRPFDPGRADQPVLPAQRPGPDAPARPARGGTPTRPGRPVPVGRWRSRAGAELLAPLRGRLILAGVFQAAVSLLQLAPYLLLVELCRRLLTDGTRADVAGLGLAALGLLGAGTTLAGVLVMAMHVVDARFGYQVRVDVVRKLSRLPLGWFTDRSSGKIRQAVQDDAANVHYLVTHAVLDVVAALVTPVAVLGYLFTVDARLAALLLVPLVVFGVLTARMVQGSAAVLPQLARWSDRISAEAVAYVDGLAVVRAYDAGVGGGFRATLAERARFLDSWQRPLTGRKALVDLVTRPVTSLLLIVVAGWALIAGGALTPVDLVPFLLLGVTFGAQLLAAAYGMASVREALAAARRIGLLLAEPELTQPTARPDAAPDPARDTGPETGATPGTATTGTGAPTVRFQDVSFGYSASRDVLSGITLDLAPGTMTALVGPSGAGKSTLAALLARFHDVTSGSITIGGVDVRDLPAAELYRTVGFVFQDVALVRATVHENIALARPGTSRAEVTDAARAAHLHERILRLPRGYDSVVGEDAHLSGGESQRLTIARALVADPRVLVLDEATAFADPESEHEVQRALSTLAADRTVLVIAHRLHTVTRADAIVVLDGGRIAQRGTHPGLLAVPGLYRDLWTATSLETAR
ncbi:ATP-binding cassette domain-containing protein [Longispora sp. NPDC051575]|uniref:ABC transporter ATP-binding protein/permease n=1 Tax=Longispora sp. NPDC051575 TaxID=3154943 RepID=UPI003430AB58